MSINVKPFQSPNDQVNILQQRGLIIDDLEEAERLLSDLNYYRLSGCTLTLRKNDKFYDNVHFSEVMQIYYFDMELHSLLLQ